jgi:hypothetical protein
MQADAACWTRSRSKNEPSAQKTHPEKAFRPDSSCRVGLERLAYVHARSTTVVVVQSSSSSPQWTPVAVELSAMSCVKRSRDAWSNAIETLVEVMGFPFRFVVTYRRLDFTARSGDGDGLYPAPFGTLVSIWCQPGAVSVSPRAPGIADERPKRRPTRASAARASVGSSLIARQQSPRDRSSTAQIGTMY